MRDRIPVSIVVKSLERGGAEQHLLAVLPLLNDSIFDVRLHPLHYGGPLTDHFVAKGVSVVGTANQAGRMAGLLKLLMTIRSSRPLVHSFLPEPYLLGASLGLIFGARSVIMSRRSRNHYQSHHPLAAWAERRLHRRMDALLGNSRAVVQDLLNEGAPPDRVRLIYNGIDVGRFPSGEARADRRRAVRNQLGIHDDQVLLTCVANLFPYKGHADLFSALALLGANRLGPLILLLVGRECGARADLEAQSARLGLAASVRFLGERGDVPDLLAASDIGVLASHEEGFSNAILEGMAASLPMVVTDVGGNAEAVINGLCGYVVPARAPAVLAQALADLIGDAGRRKTMGEAARRRVVASFTLDSCVAAYESLYEELWDRQIEAVSRK